MNQQADEITCGGRRIYHLAVAGLSRRPFALLGGISQRGVAQKRLQLAGLVISHEQTKKHRLDRYQNVDKIHNSVRTIVSPSFLFLRQILERPFVVPSPTQTGDFRTGKAENAVPGSTMRPATDPTC